MGNTEEREAGGDEPRPWITSHQFACEAVSWLRPRTYVSTLCPPRQQPAQKWWARAVKKALPTWALNAMREILDDDREDFA